MHSVRIFKVAVAERAGLAQHGDYFFIGGDEMHGGSMSAFACQNMRNGFQDDGPIELQGPVLNIRDIHAHPGVEVDVIAAAYGPKARQSGTHAQTAALPALV